MPRTRPVPLSRKFCPCAFARAPPLARLRPRARTCALVGSIEARADQRALPDPRPSSFRHPLPPTRAPGSHSEQFVPPGGLRKAPTKGGASKSALGGVVPFATADDLRKKGAHGKVTRTVVATGNSAFRSAGSNASAAKAVFEAEKGSTADVLGLPGQVSTSAR